MPWLMKSIEKIILYHKEIAGLPIKYSGDPISDWQITGLFENHNFCSAPFNKQVQYWCILEATLAP